MTFEEELLKKLGLRVKEIRNEKKLSLYDVSKKSNVEKGRLSKLEAGKANITLITLFKISNSLDVPVREFFI